MTDRNKSTQGHFHFHMKSIRTAFTLPFLAQLVVGVIVIGLILYQGGKAAVNLALLSMQKELVQQVHDQINLRLTEAMRLNEANAFAWQSGLLDTQSPDNRERWFVSHLRPNDNIAMMFLGTPDGTFYGARRTADGLYQIVRNNRETHGDSLYYRIDENGRALDIAEVFKQYDPRTRPWYKTAVEVREPAMSSIYNHFVFHEPTVTAAWPVYRNGELQGVFGVDFLLSWLGKMLRELPVGASGQVFVTDQQGMLVATSTGDYPYRNNNGAPELVRASDSGSPLMAAVAGIKSQLHSDALNELEVDGHRYDIGISGLKLSGLDWSIYVVLAEDDYLGGIQTAVVRILAVGLLILAALMLTIFFTARRVTRPVLNLNDAARKFAAGSFMPVPESGRTDELGELIRSFNVMGQQLSQLVSSLEKQVAERTRALEDKNRELEKLSFVDGLTGIANRRRLDAELEFAWNMAKRNRSSVGLIMLDIDYFKRYNDALGHLAGDDCLKMLGHVLRQTLRRNTDLAARFGGEEFVMLLPDTDAAGVSSLAEKIRQSVEELKILHPDAPDGFVTLSAGGAAMVPDADESCETLLAEADRMLYLAKENGRNRTEIRPEM